MKDVWICLCVFLYYKKVTNTPYETRKPEKNCCIAIKAFYKEQDVLSYYFCI